ncbi:hypothetical protein FIBSPDRAFT_868948 [Athelia psychrophila]|uniref:DUF6534 domain-containing protein n=1 Tax=Athelia psychrophila TaxID=1759441 RepID=A0A166CMM6_9AGAM|nr:hypothetical protein FIBSPDRAFT_868948 [Fibularhizoctonia sp. CBS 109695]
MSSPIAHPFGFILIGVFLSLILFGIVVSQTFAYYDNCDKDPRWLKWFVAILFAWDLLSSILAIAWMYELLIDNWGQIAAFTHGDWLLAGDPIIIGIVASMAQGFFAWRVYVITSSRWLAAFIATCAVTTGLAGIGTGIASLWVREYVLFVNFKQVMVIFLVSAAVGDFSITVLVTYHLRRRKGTFEATDKILDSIIRLTIQNGFITGIIAILDLCVYFASPLPYHMGISFLMPKLYSNTVLSSLNARKNLRRDLATVDDGSDLTTLRAADVVNFNGTCTSSSGVASRPEVFVEVHEMTTSDAKVNTDQSEWDRTSDTKADAEQPAWNRI